MNNDRLKQLFTAAARVELPAGADDLPEQVLRAVRREVIEPEPSVFDQIGLLLPRVALAAVLVAAACLLVESAGGGDLSSDILRASEPWLFATN